MNENLKLHEAIAIVLLNQKGRTASTEEIAKEINRRKLYGKKDGSLIDKEQIRLRTHSNTKSGQFYNYLFEFTEPDKVKLKNM
jgi:hypothetical protein